MHVVRKEVVRVVMDSEDTERFEPLINALLTLKMIFLHRQDADGCCFDFLPQERNQAWIRNAVLELQEGHFNAVVAPAWPKGE